MFFFKSVLRQKIILLENMHLYSLSMIKARFTFLIEEGQWSLMLLVSEGPVVFQL